MAEESPLREFLYNSLNVPPDMAEPLWSLELARAGLLVMTGSVLVFLASLLMILVFFFLFAGVVGAITKSSIVPLFFAFAIILGGAYAVYEWDDDYLKYYFAFVFISGIACIAFLAKGFMGVAVYTMLYHLAILAGFGVMAYGADRVRRYTLDRQRRMKATIWTVLAAAAAVTYGLFVLFWIKSVMISGFEVIKEGDMEHYIPRDGGPPVSLLLVSLILLIGSGTAWLSYLKPHLQGMGRGTPGVAVALGAVTVLVMLAAIAAAALGLPNLLLLWLVVISVLLVGGTLITLLAATNSANWS